MRTAIISDLHLSLTSGGDVLRDPGVRRILLEEIGDADRVVLLGDVVEFRERPLGAALERRPPVLRGPRRRAGRARGDDRPRQPRPPPRRAAARRSLARRRRPRPRARATTPPPARPPRSTPGSGPARLRIAYPGIWLRDDVYATHGHYMDPHLNLPRAECIATATLIRLSRKLPEQATPADYERVLRPIYGFAYGVAQARSARPKKRDRTAPSEVAWKVLNGDDDGARSGGGAGSARRCATASRPGSGRSTACSTPSSSPTSPPRRSSAAASPARPRWPGGWGSTAPT